MSNSQQAADAQGAKYVTCGFGVVHPNMCDTMGHLSTRYYLGFFEDASYHLFAGLDYDPQSAKNEGWGWADLRHEIEYLAELRSGALITIDGRVVSLGNSSVVQEYRLRDCSDGKLCARLRAKSVCFDLIQRKSRSVPGPVREAVEATFGVT